MQHENQWDYERGLQYNVITDCFTLFTRSLTLQGNLKEVLRYANYSKHAFLGRCLLALLYTVHVSYVLACFVSP